MTALSIGKGITLDTAEEMEATLRTIGATRYHSLHPFHRLLHGGKLNKGQVQAWALNRYYYQSTIPLKDAMVMTRFRDRMTRVEWRHRIEDHDGDLGSEGGIERWLKLTEGLGLDTAYVESTEGILPATRFDGRPVGTGAPGPVYRRLLAAWSADVGLDIAAQARRHAQETQV
jgi:pyrroloquinoline-quinone synthase